MEEKNLELAPRKEDTRDKFQTSVVKFKLDQILQHFTESVNAIRKQFVVADGLITSEKINEGENIWRAQVVFLASALQKIN